MQRDGDAIRSVDLISTGAAARLLGTTAQTVRNFVGSGFIGTVVGGGGEAHLRLQRDEVLALADRLAEERADRPVGTGPYRLKGHRLPVPTTPVSREIAIYDTPLT